MLKKLFLKLLNITIQITIEILKLLINILSYLKEKIKVEKEKKYRIISVDENKDYKITIKEEIEDYKNQTTTSTAEIKNEDKNCPYCHKALDKPPQRKKQCPYCHQYIYVRTRVSDGKKVLVTKKDADKIDLKWLNHFFNQEIDAIKTKHNITSIEWENARKELKKSFGREPLLNDILWSILNERLNKAILNKDDYKVREILGDQVKILEKENKLKSALGKALFICYLDCDSYSKMSLPKSKWFAPYYLIKITKIINSLNLSLDEVKEIFFEQVNIYQKILGLTYSPDEAWDDITKYGLHLK